MADEKNITFEAALAEIAKLGEVIVVRDGNIAGLEKALKEKALAHDQLVIVISEKDKEINDLKTELSEVKILAEEAIERYNALAPAKEEAFEVKVKGKGVAIVHFGVMHKGINYSKKDLIAAPDIVSHLLKIGSGAVSLKED